MRKVLLWACLVISGLGTAGAFWASEFYTASDNDPSPLRLCLYSTAVAVVAALAGIALILSYIRWPELEKSEQPDTVHTHLE